MLVLVAMSLVGIAACMAMIGGKNSPPTPIPAKSGNMTLIGLNMENMEFEDKLSMDKECRTWMTDRRA